MKIRISKITDFAFFLLIGAEVLNSSILPMISPLPSSGLRILMYGSMLLIFVLYRKGFHINMLMLLVVISAAFSLMMNDYDTKFNPVARLFSWILLIATVGPLIYNPELIRFRNRLLEGFMVIFMYVGAFSFFYWLAGGPNIGRGHFAGLMNQSMLLAPVASMGALYAFYRFIQEKKGRKKIYFLMLFFLGSLSVLLAASRTAFIAFMLAFFVYLVFNRFKFRGFILLMVTLFTIVTAYNMTENGFSAGEDSVGGELTERGLKNTRELLWTNRLIEFKSNPVFGVGFATQNEEIIVIDKQHQREDSTGRIEPGSTYLMILSMTGLLGAFSMILLLGKALISRDFWRRVSKTESYKLALFVFFSVHFVAEGYIFSSGALFACIFWLLLGATYPYSKINYQNIFYGYQR